MIRKEKMGKIILLTDWMYPAIERNAKAQYFACNNKNFNKMLHTFLGDLNKTLTLDFGLVVCLTRRR